MPEPLFHAPDLTRFHALDNPWDTDKDYCLALERDAASVLDLGCGTGELAVALAAGRRVTGVEPASAMLDHARRRAGADRVRCTAPISARPAGPNANHAISTSGCGRKDL